MAKHFDKNTLNSPPIIHSALKAIPWPEDFPPKKILVIRMHAFGDIAITLPYLNSLRKSLPEETQLDFFTCKSTGQIPPALQLFDQIWQIGGGINPKAQFLLANTLLPKLWAKKYDVIIDLQDNKTSRWIRTLLAPKSWVIFDKYGPSAAGDRFREAIDAAKVSPKINLDTDFIFKEPTAGQDILRKTNWLPGTPLIVLNPAGFFENRNWPLENYLEFVRLWTDKFGDDSRFLVLGTDHISDKAHKLREKVGPRLINLVNQTSRPQAYAILRHASFMLSEDSGLMHMAWTQGVPTLALFGSTRSDWAQPLGRHSEFFDSSDMECGNCMLTECKFGDNRCMTRLSPAQVFEMAVKLYRHI